MSGWETVIGLEIHAQLTTASKIFCGCPTAFGAPPNTQTCPVCGGFPGTLPVMNRKVVDYLMTMAMATGSRISRLSRMARKNYFYPDLPKGYQISQFEEPLAVGGSVEIIVGGVVRSIGLTRIHIEEDAGKLVHAKVAGVPASLVDFNRCGVPLIEIVSEPDLRTPEGAKEYLTTLRTLVRYLGICDGNMEEGSFRCDANVSIRPAGQAALGVKTEVKNINSFRFVQKALEYEVDRQVEILEAGGTIVQETRLWDDARGMTFSMRGKEEAHDYRYFPDPDLVPIVVDDAWIEAIRASLPELPRAKRERFATDFSLPPEQADLLTSERALADFFEEAARLSGAPREAANWITGQLLAEINRDGREIGSSPVTPAYLAELVGLIAEGTISGKMAKDVLSRMYAAGKGAREIVESAGLAQISDETAIAAAVDEVLDANAALVDQYRAGGTKVFGFLVGAVMKRTAGKANPALVNQLLKEKLGG